MGGLLSGIDQSLISGANLFMPSCKLQVSFSITKDLLTELQPLVSTRDKNLWSALVFLSEPSEEP